MELINVAVLAWIAIEDYKSRIIHPSLVCVLVAIQLLKLPDIYNICCATVASIGLLLIAAKTDCLGGGDIKLFGVCALSL